MTGASGQLLVESSDGTSLAVWVAGEGPPMVLVHGSFGDHSAWTVPIEVLTRRYTTYAMDRRGLGASGDTPPYSIEREFDDVAAVAESVFGESGEPVIVWGHSYGANCAMGGSSGTPAIRHLILYEPSLGLTYPPGAIEAAESMLADGDRAGAIDLLLRDVLDMSSEEIEQLRAGPRWPNLLASAHTAPRECRAEEAWVYPTARFSGIGVPTLMLSGTDSPDTLHRATALAAAAIPGAEIQSLAGHGHFAHRTDPAMVVEIIHDFVTSKR